MPPTKTDDVRKLVEKRMSAWRGWKSFHTWTYLVVGAISSAVATFVAINSKYDIMCKKYAWIPPPR
jgi:hypothetical protein